LFALDPVTGQHRLVYDHAEGGSFAAPPVIGADEAIYLATRHDGVAVNSAILALEPAGNVRWITHVNKAGFEAPPALGWNGSVYAGSLDGYVYALRADGSPAWRFATDGVAGPGEGSVGPVSSPALWGDGTIYIGSEDGIVYVLDATGALMWRYQT